MRLSLKLFLTLSITLILTFFTSIVIFIYTDIIKDEVHLLAKGEAQGLVDSDKSTIVRMIQLGTYLELNQHLKNFYGKNRLIKKVDVFRDDENLASFSQFDKSDVSSNSIRYSFSMVEYGVKWGDVVIVIDQEEVKDKIFQKMKRFYIIGGLVLFCVGFCSYLLSVFISREVNKIMILINKWHVEIQSATNLSDLQKRLEQDISSKSFLSEISSVENIFTSFLKYIKEANMRLNKLESVLVLEQQAQQIAHDIRSP